MFIRSQLHREETPEKDKFVMNRLKLSINTRLCLFLDTHVNSIVKYRFPETIASFIFIRAHVLKRKKIIYDKLVKICSNNYF